MPTRSDSTALVRGRDKAVIKPPRSKAYYDGTIWGAHPIWLVTAGPEAWAAPRAACAGETPGGEGTAVEAVAPGASALGGTECAAARSGVKARGEGTAVGAVGWGKVLAAGTASGALGACVLEGAT